MCLAHLAPVEEERFTQGSPYSILRSSSNSNPAVLEVRGGRDVLAAKVVL